MSWHPEHLTPAQLEERRVAAGRLLRAGRLSQAEIARGFGVTPAAVSQWARRLREAGAELSSLRQRRRSGRPPRLSPAEWAHLLGVLRAGAGAAGFDTERWTLRRIARVVRREFGRSLHPSSLSRGLRVRGWSVQRPAVRARERDDALVAAWLRRDWPRIKRGLAAAGRSLPSWTKRVTRFGPA
ncbi:MAG: winged helix-turn-helix domain-containing protein [Gemmataceae bacterium]|nr:winged helix-turn-helix domain-containing protein [Gemmataceae bacterium]